MPHLSSLIKMKMETEPQSWFVWKRCRQW